MPAARSKTSARPTGEDKETRLSPNLSVSFQGALLGASNEERAGKKQTNEIK